MMQAESGSGVGGAHRSSVLGSRPWARIFALTVFFSGTAHAGFAIVEPPPAPKVLPAAAPRSGYAPLGGSPEFASAGPFAKSEGSTARALTYIGSPPEEIEIRRGMGRDMRLADALRLIAPQGWRGFGRAEIAGSFDADKRVNWKGGKPWTDVLSALAREQGLSIDVDWGNRRLYVGKRAAAEKTMTASTQAAPAPAPPAWVAKQGSTVRATVEDWAKKAGWTTVWPMADLDYRIVAPLSFNGSIVEAAGKIAQLYERAERPLAVDIHINQKLIVFSEKGVASP